MRTLAIKLTGMPASLKLAPLVAELSPILSRAGFRPIFDEQTLWRGSLPNVDETRSRFLLSEDSPTTIEVPKDDEYDEYLIRVFTFRGPVRAKTVSTPEIVNEVEVRIEPEDVIAPLFPEPRYQHGPPDSLRMELGFAGALKPRIWRRAAESSKPAESWDAGARTIRIERKPDDELKTRPFLKFQGINVPSKLVWLPPLTEVHISLFGLTSETAVQRRGAEYDPLGLRTVIVSRGVESIQGYLQAGDLSSAGFVADDIMRDVGERSLTETDLTAILSCGYLSLAGNFHFKRFDSLLALCKDLSPNSTDAAVITGWHYWLENNLESARENWKKAVESGTPPIFSRGLKLLYDGLRLEPELANYAPIVAGIAARADWSQPLTTLYGRVPNDPELGWVYEF